MHHFYFSWNVKMIINIICGSMKTQLLLYLVRCAEPGCLSDRKHTHILTPKRTRACWLKHIGKYINSTRLASDLDLSFMKWKEEKHTQRSITRETSIIFLRSFVMVNMFEILADYNTEPNGAVKKNSHVRFM